MIGFDSTANLARFQITSHAVTNPASQTLRQDLARSLEEQFDNSKLDPAH